MLGLGVAALLFAGIELGLRARYEPDVLLFEWERPTGLIATSDAGDIVTRPNMTDARKDGPYPWRISLNDLGFREDAAVPTSKAEGSVRILALGDSWMFGFSVDQGAAIPDVVEQQVSESLGQPVEVLNAGVFGSGAFDMLRRYRQMVDVYHPDGILLGQPHNAAHSRSLSANRSAWYRSVREGPASTWRTYLLVRRWLAPLRSGMYAEMVRGEGREPEYQDMRTLAQDARRRGLPVWFVLFPDRLDQALSGFQGSEDWRTELAAEGVLFAGHRLGERACWGFQDIGHPSAAGAFVIATNVSQMITKKQSIPVSDTPRCIDGPAPGPGKPGWEWAHP